MHLKHQFRLCYVACLLTLATIPVAAQTQPPRQGATRATASAGQAAPQPYRRPYPCKSTKQIGLSGVYNGMLAIGEGAKKPERATLAVSGNEFSLESASFKGKGYITGTNSCGDTAFALRFTEVLKAGSQNVSRLLASATSLDAIAENASGETLNRYSQLSEARAFLLQTIITPNGMLGGPKIIFQRCPPPPCKSENYPKCPDCVK